MSDPRVIEDDYVKEVVYNEKSYKVIEVFSTGYILVVECNAEFPVQPLIIPNVIASQ